MSQKISLKRSLEKEKKAKKVIIESKIESSIQTSRRESTKAFKNSTASEILNQYSLNQNDLTKLIKIKDA